MIRRLARVPRPVRLAVATFGLVLLLRACGAAPYRVPSGSMMDTLLPGDFVLAEKLTFGARLPFGLRAPGLRAPRRGDVVVFTSPAGTGQRLLKRIVALPGDTVALVAGEVVVDGRVQAPPPHARLPWVTCAGERLDLSPAEAAAPRACPLVRFRAHRETRALATFPEGAGSTETDVAPLRVPRQGDTLHLRLATWPRVRDVLRLEGHKARLLPGGTVTLDGATARTYIVRDDYYYVLGDHRSASTDSRAWGFVPRRALIGRAAVVYYSAEPSTGRPRWSRVGRPVQ